MYNNSEILTTNVENTNLNIVKPKLPNDINFMLQKTVNKYSLIKTLLDIVVKTLFILTAFTLEIISNKILWFLLLLCAIRVLLVIYSEIPHITNNRLELPAYLPPFENIDEELAIKKFLQINNFSFLEISDVDRNLILTLQEFFGLLTKMPEDIKPYAAITPLNQTLFLYKEQIFQNLAILINSNKINANQNITYLNHDLSKINYLSKRFIQDIKEIHKFEKIKQDNKQHFTLQIGKNHMDNFPQSTKIIACAEDWIKGIKKCIVDLQLLFDKPIEIKNHTLLDQIKLLIKHKTIKDNLNAQEFAKAINIIPLLLNGDTNAANENYVKLKKQIENYQIVVDPNLQYLDNNQQISKLIGYKPWNIIGYQKQLEPEIVFQALSLKKSLKNNCNITGQISFSNKENMLNKLLDKSYRISIIFLVCSIVPLQPVRAFVLK